MITLNATKMQLEYLHYVISHYAYSNEDFDEWYKLSGLDILDKVNRLLKHKRHTRKLKLDRIQKVVISDFVTLYYAGIAHDEKLVWERRYLITVSEELKIV